jgi:glycosyltransferase involved in cell wall biosynthesis
MSNFYVGNNPLVSVGIPVFNDDSYVALAIQDILNQDYNNLEIIISDNCSSDFSGDICVKFSSRYPNIKYIRQRENIGPQRNFQYLVGRASGKYFMWAASDDRWEAGYISKLVGLLENSPDSAVAFCPYEEIDESGNAISDIFRFNFNGRSAIKRIAKFHLEKDGRRDAFFYGIFRRDVISRVRFVTWWGINKNIPMDIAFPILSYVLASGSYCFVESAVPLWRKRVLTMSPARHSADYAHRPIFSYFAHCLRKINQFYETERDIVRGGGLVNGVISVPFVACRCICDCWREGWRGLKGILKRARRRVF